MSKSSSDQRLLDLPEAQQAKLAEWLLGGMPYHEARVLVEKEFGVELRSLSPFGYFWSRVCVPYLLARREQMVETAAERAEAAMTEPGRFDLATLDALRQKAYELAESPAANLKDTKAVLSLLLKARSEDRADRKLEFHKQKFEFDACAIALAHAAELKAISSDPALSDAEKINLARQKLFGQVPTAK